MTPQQLAEWLTDQLHKQRGVDPREPITWRRISSIECDCSKESRALMTLHVGPGGHVILWMCSSSGPDQSGALTKSPAVALDLEGLPDGAIGVTKCPRCSRGLLVSKEGNKIQCGWFGSPTRATMAE